MFLNPARSKARVLGFDRVGQVNPYFKKNSKRRRFSKKNQRVATRFLTGFCRVNLSGRLGHTGSIPILKKIKNDIVLVKKKWSTGCNLVFDRVLPGQPTGSTGSHRVMTFLIFSSTRPGSSPGSTRRAGPGFKTMVYIFYIHKKKVKKSYVFSMWNKKSFWFKYFNLKG